MSRIRLATLVLTLAALGACETATPSIAPSPPATAAPDVPAPSQAVPSTSPPPPAVVTPVARWRQPEAGQRLSSSQVRLAARVESPGRAVDRVTYRATWDGGQATLCSAKAPADNGSWSCTADLIEDGVPVGPIELSLDVRTDDLVLEGLAGSRNVLFAAVPPKPGDTSIEHVRTSAFRNHQARQTWRVSWATPQGYASTFRLYRLDSCPTGWTRANDGKPCIEPGMAVPMDDLIPLAIANDPDRSMTFKQVIGDGLNGPMGNGTILLRATNAYGDSTFAVVGTDIVCWRCTY